MFAAFALVACAMPQRAYEGPRRPLAAIASLYKMGDAYIVRVDGVTPYGYNESDSNVVEMIPGARTLELAYFEFQTQQFQYEKYTSNSLCVLSINLEAGKKYSLLSARTDNNWNAWIVEGTSLRDVFDNEPPPKAIARCN